MWTRIGVIVALCAVVAGCSSGPAVPAGDSSADGAALADVTTMADYVAAAEAACSAYIHGFVAIAEQAGPIESEQDYEKFVKDHHTEVMSVYAEYRTAIASLTPPEDAAQQHDQIVTLMGQNVDLGDQVGEAYTRGDDAQALSLVTETSAAIDQDIAEVQSDLGIQACGA